MIDIQSVNKNVAFIKGILSKTWLVVSLIEILLYPYLDTIAVLLISSIGLLVCGAFVFNTKNLLYYPVSTIAIIMYPFFFMYLPPIATLLELKPVIYNLHNPSGTFANILVLECALIFIHYIYKKLSSRFKLKKCLYRHGFFDRLSQQELWFSIIISLAFFAIAILGYGLYGEESENTRSEMPLWLQAGQFVFGGCYSMVFIFFMKKFNVIKPPFKPKKILICLTVAISMIVGIATNMRTASISCFSTGLFLFIVYNFYHPVNIKQFLSFKKLILLGFAVYFFTGPFMDISRAMLLSRGGRNGLSGTEVLEMTLSNLGNTAETKEEEHYKATSNIWDEEYLSNHILNRFCSVKIHDESIYCAEKLGYSNAVMRHTLFEKILDDLPGVIKKKVGLNYGLEMRTFSLTDKLANLSLGNPLGGVKIGSLQGLGLALWGWWYLVVLIPVYIILFYLLDSLVYFKDNEMHFSYLFLFNVVTFVYWFSDRHYYQWEFRWIFRTFWESLVFFYIYMIVVKRIPFIKH